MMVGFADQLFVLRSLGTLSYFRDPLRDECSAMNDLMAAMKPGLRNVVM